MVFLNGWVMINAFINEDSSICHLPLRILLPPPRYHKSPLLGLVSKWPSVISLLQFRRILTRICYCQWGCQGLLSSLLTSLFPLMGEVGTKGQLQSYIFFCLPENIFQQ